MAQLPSEEDRQQAMRSGMSLALWAKRTPDAPAILGDGGNRTFAELNANANRLARALRARGVGKGDSIGLICSNRAEFAEVLYAAQRIGVRFTPINWHLTAEEAAYILGDCEAKALVADARFAPSAAGAAERCPDLNVRLSVGGEIPGFESYERALSEQAGTDLDDPVLGGRMLYTSGTTGQPKGVSRPKLVSMRPTATSSAASYQNGTGQLHLTTGPLYHAAPMAFSLTVPLLHGVGCVLMDKWDPERALELIATHRITHSHLVPTMFHRLLRLPEATRKRYDVSSMRYIVHGAAPCPVATKHAIMDWFGPIVWEYYAATEGSGSVIGPHDWLKKPGSVGKPATADHVKIVGEEGEELPAGEVGTVYLKLLKGAEFTYYKDEAKTQRARRGTHYTLGDVGYLDEDGFLFLTDRSAHLIISGGVNIYPAEVEAVLHEHPAVGDVGVIGVPNTDWGEEVKAVVELSAGHLPSDELAQSMIAFCRERLAHFKCPRSVDFIDALPRQPSGKLYKQKLRSDYRQRAQ